VCQEKLVDINLLWMIVLILAVLSVLGVWFHWCGHADKARQMRAFAMSTLRYAGVGFVVGVAFLTSDLGTPTPEARLGVVAITVCCFLLIYSAASAVIASNDQSIVLVNLTGRALLLSDPNSRRSIRSLPKRKSPPACCHPSGLAPTTW